MKLFKELDRELLLEVLGDFARNWLAHDGLWFLEVEKEFGMEAAIKLDARAWQQFTVIEARRIMKRHSIPPESGLEGLKKALYLRMYTLINEQEIVEEREDSFIFRMVNCRVQAARERKNLPLFPCKQVGLVEYSCFARTIDPRIETSCISCPPDPPQEQFYCAWKFTLSGEKG